MTAARTLIYAPNWLGDAVMAMPALQVWRRWNPGTSLTVLTKTALAPLWRMHPAVDEVMELGPGNAGTLLAARDIRARAFSDALILPNSFRSALIPWKAGVPRRRGFARHGRTLLLTERAQPRLAATHAHQCWENADILLGDGWWEGEGLPPPQLGLSRGDVHAACRAFRIPPDSLLVGIIPGAARGSSKRWPHFGEAAARLAAEIERLRFVVLGTAAESGLCREVAARVGPAATCVAGGTTMPQFAALLAACQLVLCNDSGGMHLAAAVGTPVVAVFGMTDPGRTGPLGAGHAVVRRDDVQGDRAISRNSRDAQAVLASIEPDRVVGAARKLLRRPPRVRVGEAAAED